MLNWSITFSESKYTYEISQKQFELARNLNTTDKNEIYSPLNSFNKKCCYHLNGHTTGRNITVYYEGQVYAVYSNLIVKSMSGTKRIQKYRESIS